MAKIERNGIAVEYEITGTTCSPDAPKGSIGGCAMTSWIRINGGRWMNADYEDFEALEKAFQ